MINGANFSFFGYLRILSINFHITSRYFSSIITSIVKFRMTYWLEMIMVYLQEMIAQEMCVSSGWTTPAQS